MDKNYFEVLPGDVLDMMSKYGDNYFDLIVEILKWKVKDIKEIENYEGEFEENLKRNYPISIENDKIIIGRGLKYASLLNLKRLIYSFEIGNKYDSKVAIPYNDLFVKLNSKVRLVPLTDKRFKLIVIDDKAPEESKVYTNIFKDLMNQIFDFWETNETPKNRVLIWDNMLHLSRVPFEVIIGEYDDEVEYKLKRLNSTDVTDKQLLQCFKYSPNIDPKLDIKFLNLELQRYSTNILAVEDSKGVILYQIKEMI